MTSSTGGSIQNKKENMSMRLATSEEIVAVLGTLDEAAVAAIIATGATLHDVEVAAQWLAGADDVMGKQREPLGGVAAAIAEIVEADQPEEDHP
jgi:hypothetical protein